jgi:hypothetical protein
VQTSREAGLLNCKQLGLLATNLLAVTENQYITTRNMADVLQKLASASGADAFPELWRRPSFKQMRDALALFDPHLSSYIDWKHVVSSLVLESFPRVANARPDQFATAAAHLQRRRYGVLTEGGWHARCGSRLARSCLAALRTWRRTLLSLASPSVRINVTKPLRSRSSSGTSSMRYVIAQLQARARCQGPAQSTCTCMWIVWGHQLLLELNSWPLADGCAASQALCASDGLAQYSQAQWHNWAV